MYNVTNFLLQPYLTMLQSSESELSQSQILRPLCDSLSNVLNTSSNFDNHSRTATVQPCDRQADVTAKQ
jgi:hypothetical protein